MDDDDGHQGRCGCFSDADGWRATNTSSKLTRFAGLSSTSDRQSCAMPSATSSAEIESFIRLLEPAQMADLLLELSGAHDAVRKRLLRLMLADNPKRLAAGFRKSLTSWRRAKTFFGYREAREFGLELEDWLGQVERELLPRDPAAALELAEAFIESDADFFNRADDSDGVIGDAIRAGCRLWLKAAALCESPADTWPGRLDALACADEYGPREALYRHADDLLDEPALRCLVEKHMTRMTAALAGPSEAGRMPAGVFSISSTLSLLSHALHDPDVHVRAVLTYSPQPNAQQMEVFVREYLDCDRPADALPWLGKDWGSLDDTRRRLLATVLGKLGRDAESASLLQGVFEKTMSVYDLTSWIEALLPSDQSQAVARARELAVRHQDPVDAARVLVEIGDHALAESALLAAPGKINGQDYPWLVPLAKALEAHECWVGATAVYRALLDAILNRAYARAYGHAFQYWERLGVIAERGADLAPLGMHELYVADIRRKHARKVSFWAYVNGTRQVEPGTEVNDDDEA